jgi:tetratricopeptide (TPR) repeat protein
MITSRNPQFLDCTPVDINVFTETVACEFIEKYTKKPADEHFKILAEKMGYLPLALDQAGVYMAINKKSYEESFKLYEQKNLTLLQRYKNDPGKQTVATTWQISFDKINNPAAKQLLKLCAFFAPENIFKEFFTLACKVLPKELRVAVTDEMVYDEDVIAELTKYSLITLNENGFLSIHRLVQEVIRDSLKQEQAVWRNYCVNILNKFRNNDFSTAELRTRFSSLIPHITSVTDGISDDEAKEEVANLYHFLGYGYNELADYDPALEYYGKALNIVKKVLGEEHPYTASTYNNIALVYDHKGDYDLALEYYGKALDIVKKVLGEEHPDTATTYNNIAGVYDNKGDYDLALEYYKKDLVISEKVLGKEHPDTATTYNNIAAVYDNKGDYDLALEYYEKALAIDK